MAAEIMQESAHTDSEFARLEAERQRLTEALSLAERERQLLGYEIHDSILQDLSAAAMLLEGANRQATFASPENQESHAAGLRLLRDSISGARHLIGGLTQVGLSSADLRLTLRHLVQKFRDDHSLPVTFECEADDLRLPPTAQHMLLRIAQESLFNVSKHAQAQHVVVRLSKTRQELTLSITDDGNGFDPETLGQNGNSVGLGMLNMREMTEFAGGRFTIVSAPAQGTLIRVEI